MLKEEVPLIITNLTPAGLERAAVAGFHFLQTMGYSLDEALEVLGDTPAAAPRARHRKENAS
ncbi:MAG: hypothetical protein LBP29_09595 [Treponema sp.]|jgi:hypothetical protein|nr:hypothetical protein [Treponema sp.]